MRSGVGCTVWPIVPPTFIPDSFAVTELRAPPPTIHHKFRDDRQFPCCLHTSAVLCLITCCQNAWDSSSIPYFLGESPFFLLGKKRRWLRAQIHNLYLYIQPRNAFCFWEHSPFFLSFLSFFLGEAAGR